jgi:Immunity protein Imm1
MLILWTDLASRRHQQRHVAAADLAGLDDLMDRLDEQASRDGDPAAVQIYAGNHYPQASHYHDSRHIPDDPGDGPQPVLFLTVGGAQTPLYWIEANGREHTSKGSAGEHKPEFEYLYGGQESYAPACQLIPREQAREAARLFLASGGQQPRNITWHTESTG